MYPAELVKPMSQDLTEFGFTGLETSEAVVTALDQPEGTTLLVVNSVCG
ncbi:BrxA/BrxB family bacilliredoxin, partial [Saprospiraceae bacterium]|nr:BrxA/BrxB family bacilliredoxin [Saprospiraceae bacterium]